MNNNVNIPVGTYVKIKTDLKMNCFDYGIYFNSDMVKLMGTICIVSELHRGPRYTAVGERTDENISYIKLRRAANNMKLPWTWTPGMLEIVSNEDIDMLRS